MNTRKREAAIYDGLGAFLARGKRFARPSDVVAAKRALSDDDRALHLALRFGRPQMMAGNGRWDNARYMRAI